jgi:PKD domain-containing protein
MARSHTLRLILGFLPVTMGVGALGLTLAQIATPQKVAVVPSGQRKAPAASSTTQTPMAEVPPLVLQLTADNNNPFVDQVVHFRATWNQPVSQARYRFVWGDGKFDDSDSPGADHTYSLVQVCTAYVTAQALVNGQVSRLESKPLTVSVIPPPPDEVQLVPSLSASPSHLKAGEPVTFTAYIDSSAGQVEYHFYFDDGNDKDTHTNKTVHSYALPGTYAPYVSVSLGQGKATITSDKIELNIDPPKLTLDLRTKEPVAGKDLVVQASLDPPQESVAYLFDWGDRSGPEKGRGNGTAIHAYWLPGTYTLEVSAWLKGTAIPLKEHRQIVVGWSVTLLWVLGAAAIGAALYFIYRLIRPPVEPSGSDFRITPHPGDAEYEISLKEQAGSHLSLTLNPGADPEEHRITFL